MYYIILADRKRIQTLHTSMQVSVTFITTNSSETLCGTFYPDEHEEIQNT